MRCERGAAASKEEISDAAKESLSRLLVDVQKLHLLRRCSGKISFATIEPYLLSLMKLSERDLLKTYFPSLDFFTLEEKTAFCERLVSSDSEEVRYIIERLGTLKKVNDYAFFLRLVGVAKPHALCKFLALYSPHFASVVHLYLAEESHRLEYEDIADHPLFKLITTRMLKLTQGEIFESILTLDRKNEIYFLLRVIFVTEALKNCFSLKEFIQHALTCYSKGEIQLSEAHEAIYVAVNLFGSPNFLNGLSCLEKEVITTATCSPLPLYAAIMNELNIPIFEKASRRVYLNKIRKQRKNKRQRGESGVNGGVQPSPLKRPKRSNAKPIDKEESRFKNVGVTTRAAEAVAVAKAVEAVEAAEAEAEAEAEAAAAAQTVVIHSGAASPFGLFHPSPQQQQALNTISAVVAAASVSPPPRPLAPAARYPSSDWQPCWAPKLTL